MLVDSMILCFGCGWKIFCCLVGVSCVYSGSILVWCRLVLCSIFVVLWIFCLLGRNISMLLGCLLILCLWVVILLRVVRMFWFIDKLFLIWLFFLLVFVVSGWYQVFIGQVWLEILIIGVLLKCWEKCFRLMVVEVMISFRFGCWCKRVFRQLRRKLMFRLCLWVLLMISVLQCFRQWLCWVLVRRMLLVISLIRVLLLFWFLKCIWQLISVFSGVLIFFVICVVMLCVVS